MRNSMLQSEMPDVIYQVTETSYSPRDEDEYEVPISQRLGSDSSATGTSKSSAGSGYAPIRMKDALTSLQRRVEDDAGSVYSCTKAVDARTNAPVTRKPVIDVGIDRRSPVSWRAASRVTPTRPRFAVWQIVPPENRIRVCVLRWCRAWRTACPRTRATSATASPMPSRSR